MDLWIRSQDGEDLWKANAITIQDYLKTKAVDIVVSSGMEQIKKFATYNTKEKALKVLDEIQNKLCLSFGYSEYPLRIIKRPDNTMDVQQLKADVLVYEMPQDAEANND